MAHDPAALATARRFGLVLTPQPSTRPTPTTRPTSRTADQLTAAGWTQITDASHRQACGMPGAATGHCERNARWQEHRNARPMCAQHAAQMIR